MGSETLETNGLRIKNAVHDFFTDKTTRLPNRNYAKLVQTVLFEENALLGCIMVDVERTDPSALAQVSETGYVCIAKK